MALTIPDPLNDILITMQSGCSLLRVASYNIRKSVGLDWKRDSARIMRVLGEIDADVVALQEADKRFGERQGTLPAQILQLELGYKFADIPNSGTSHGWHGNAILYREPLEPVETKPVNIPVAEPRGAIATRFDCSNGKYFQLIGTHLSLLGAMRARQIRAITNYIRQTMTDCPTIVAGDFNEWRERGKAYRAAGPDFNVVTPGASFHSARPGLPLDRFILSGGIRLEDCGVHKSASAKVASDHLPIYVDIDLN